MSLPENRPTKLGRFDMNGKERPMAEPLHLSILALHLAVAILPLQPEHFPLQSGFSNLLAHVADNLL
jgi:hypothetical protein